MTTRAQTVTILFTDLVGSTELLGHLPVYGVFLTLLAYGSDPRTAEAVRWLPSRTKRAPAPEPALS